MPDLTFPPEFGEMSRTLSSAFNLDFVTDVGEANCSLGSNHCYRIMVMMFSLLAFQLASPAGYSLAKGLQTKGIVSQKRVEALVDRCIHGNILLTNPNPDPNPNPSRALTLTRTLARTQTPA
jgi:hypothetical protein